MWPFYFKSILDIVSEEVLDSMSTTSNTSIEPTSSCPTISCPTVNTSTWEAATHAPGNLCALVMLKIIRCFFYSGLCCEGISSWSDSGIMYWLSKSCMCLLLWYHRIDCVESKKEIFHHDKQTAPSACI